MFNYTPDELEIKFGLWLYHKFFQEFVNICDFSIDEIFHHFVALPLCFWLRNLKSLIIGIGEEDHSVLTILNFNGSQIQVSRCNRYLSLKEWWIQLSFKILILLEGT